MVDYSWMQLFIQIISLSKGENIAESWMDFTFRDLPLRVFGYGSLYTVQLKQGKGGCWSWMKMNAEEERIASNDPWHKLVRSHGSHRYHLPYGLQSQSNPKTPGEFICA